MVAFVELCLLFSILLRNKNDNGYRFDNAQINLDMAVVASMVLGNTAVPLLLFKKRAMNIPQITTVVWTITLTTLKVSKVVSKMVTKLGR